MNKRTWTLSSLTMLALIACSIKHESNSDIPMDSSNPDAIETKTTESVSQRPTRAEVEAMREAGEQKPAEVKEDAVVAQTRPTRADVANQVQPEPIAEMDFEGVEIALAAPPPSTLAVRSRKMAKRRVAGRMSAPAMAGSSSCGMPPAPIASSQAADWTAGMPNTEEYTDHGVNPFTQSSEDALSTFSIDVDTASYTNSRRMLNAGQLPPWEAIRVEEFVNYFDYDYTDPDDSPFSVHMEAMPDPFRADHHILRVGVQAKRHTPESRPPLHLTFLADVSGSMSSTDKLPLAKKAMHTLVENLQDGDTVALATYAGRVARILEPTDVSKSRSIHQAIDQLNSGGSTAMSSGIDLAYEMAMEAMEKGAENRVVILSDGDANVGTNSWEDMLRQIKGYADKGVTLSTIGFGRGNYRDTLMEQLANKGDGNNYYVDGPAEADRIFGEKIAGTMITVGRDVKIQVEFDPDVVKEYRLVGYENRDIADKDFRNDRVDAGEVGSGHSVTALYEVVLAKDHDAELATVRMRWEKPGPDGVATEQDFAFKSRALKGSADDASDALQLAYAAASFAEVLRQSPHASTMNLGALQEMVDGASNSKEAKELSKLIAQAAKLGATQGQAKWAEAKGTTATEDDAPTRRPSPSRTARR